MSGPEGWLLGYHGIVLAGGLVLLGVLLLNMAVLPDLRRYPPPALADAPLVSVLVPARNEAANIEACVRGLLASNYPAFEVLVLDDESTDGTAAILAPLAAADPRLRVLGGTPLPPGWMGKAHACAQLASAARGALLLFTDADVRHAPALLGHAVAVLRAREAGLLSIFPTQITGSLAERLVVPVMQHFAAYVLLPLPLMTSLRSRAFAAANGQFLLFGREAYDACGGHAAVRGLVLEDVALARAVKAAGLRIMLANGHGLVACRMYDGATQVWAGFGKNLFAFFNRSWLFLIAAAVVSGALWVLPPIMALAALPGALGQPLGGSTWVLVLLPAAQYGVTVLTRLILAVRCGGRTGDSLLHPLGVAMVLAIAIHSGRLAARGGATWKGRSVGRQAD
ncbi:MAG TPA: glycosyltransferase [Chloroflexia bacterium]|nr:glycosyltransferase [Chloroflexia bacterium]